MKIYIVDTGYMGIEIEAIYSSREQAEKAAEDSDFSFAKVLEYDVIEPRTGAPLV